MTKRTILLLCFYALSACQQAGQNVYDEKDMGRSAVVVFGKVLSERPIIIKRETTGAGATAGAAAGAVGGSAVGGGRGKLLMIIAGAVAGGVAGHYGEQAIINDRGIEYTIRLTDGVNMVLAVAQNISKDDKPIPVGSCVMLQTGNGYQRVLPADDTSLCRHKR